MKRRTVANAESRNPYADIQVELTAMIFDRILSTVVTGGVMMIVLTGSTAHHYHDLKLGSLTAAMGLLWIGRLAIVLRFPSDPLNTLTPKSARRWEMLYGYYTALYMSTMGASILLSMSNPNPVHFMYCVFGTFALCNALGARMGTRPRMVMFQVSGMLAAMVIAILHQKEIMGRFSAVVIVAYAFTFWEAVRSKFAITVDQLRSRRQQRHLAEHDALTSLANRRHFEASLSTLCEGTTSFAVFFLDLDGFKKINDLHGHAAGDLLLQHVAERLRNTVRASDLIARLGGDEFAILHTPQATRETASVLAARVIDRISAPYEIGGLELQIGTSIGIQLSRPGANNPDTLLSEADHALYTVKQRGKGVFQFADRCPVPFPGPESANAGELTVVTA